ncbi:DUF4032 domain-containing protein [Agrococcus jejuensis]|uniref:Lipopolysaccharide kinase (Kdo/WaaP) family protein n=1 Tax=Agrococcus jejuensis TaxID=399736 RepID=A0A1G8BAM0_9MICO|nr:DUF4032 domain-containing protein [Agrococcus jejuensis]SDH30131.1 Lipopolysaccharide kinase (Kdo/WaaP) family protein [Agrococcus jejuensis]
MSGNLRITSALMDATLLEMPWHLPLDQWPDDVVVTLPKGISRHLVRFAHLSGRVVALKETSDEMARGEYDMLRRLGRLQVPCVEPLAVVAGRVDEHGEPLETILATRHLKFSMPYRALYSGSLKVATAQRLVDALALLLVRLHLVGFFWGDVSLSNTLFRRDAGAFAAYLVDAETGKLYPGGLSRGQRENDLEIARVNIAGELLDLQAGGRLDEGQDPVDVAGSIVAQYRELWAQLTEVEQFDQAERWRINERVERLNALGFDIDELQIRTDADGTSVRIQPKVVDAGHHHRRLLGLTGLDAEENQARRMLNDLDQYAAAQRRRGDDADDEQLAHDWLVSRFEPIVQAVPRHLRGRLEPAEVFHQVLEHRWYIAERESRGVPLAEAVQSYIVDVLEHRRDEAAVLEVSTQTVPIPIIGPNGQPIGDEDLEVDWRDLV